MRGRWSKASNPQRMGRQTRSGWRRRRCPWRGGRGGHVGGCLGGPVGRRGGAHSRVCGNAARRGGGGRLWVAARGSPVGRRGLSARACVCGAGGVRAPGGGGADHLGAGGGDDVVASGSDGGKGAVGGCRGRPVGRRGLGARFTSCCYRGRRARARAGELWEAGAATRSAARLWRPCRRWLLSGAARPRGGAGLCAAAAVARSVDAASALVPFFGRGRAACPWRGRRRTPRHWRWPRRWRFRRQLRGGSFGRLARPLGRPWRLWRPCRRWLLSGAARLRRRR